MNWWNDLDTIKAIRVILIWITCIAPVATAIFATKEYFLIKQKSVSEKIEKDKEQLLTKQKSVSEKINKDIEKELSKAYMNYVSMKNNDSEGMAGLIELSLKSKSSQVKTQAKEYLNKAQEYFNKKASRVPMSNKDWGFLKNITPKQVEEEIEFILRDKITIEDKHNLIMNFNARYGTEFKVFELDKLKKWREDKEYIPLLLEAKNK